MKVRWYTFCIPLEGLLAIVVNCYESESKPTASYACCDLHQSSIVLHWSK